MSYGLNMSFFIGAKTVLKNFNMWDFKD